MASDIFNNGDFFVEFAKSRRKICFWIDAILPTSPKPWKRIVTSFQTKDNFEIEAVLFNLTVLSCYTLQLSNELDLRGNFNYSGCWFQAYSDQPLHLLNRLYSIRYSPLVLLHRCKCKFFQQRTPPPSFFSPPQPTSFFQQRTSGKCADAKPCRTVYPCPRNIKVFFFCNKSPKSTLRHSQSSAAIATYGVRGINVKYKRGMQCKRQSKVQ